MQHSRSVSGVPAVRPAERWKVAGMKRMFFALLLIAPAFAQERAERTIHSHAFPEVEGVSRFEDGQPVSAEIRVGGHLESLEAATQMSLRGHGWVAASAKRREKLALAWCVEVLQALEQPSAREATAVTQPDGSVIVTVYVMRTGGYTGARPREAAKRWRIGRNAKIRPLPAG
jgi:hypothetical protein